MKSQRKRAIASLSGPDAFPRMDRAEACALIEFFQAEVDRAARTIEEAWKKSDAASVRDVASQLKDAAAGYGYPQIAELAELLERALLEDEAALSSASEKVESLLQTCRSVAMDCD